MILILGLFLLITATGVAVSAVAANSGSAHSLGEAFVIFGQSVTDLSIGQLFGYGVIVGGLGMLGLAMLLGAFNQSLASRGARRALKGSRSESAALRLDRERLTQQLDDERSEHPSAAAKPTVDAPLGAADEAATRATQPAGHSGGWHRVGGRTND